jgi:hypothetical protein
MSYRHIGRRLDDLIVVYRFMQVQLDELNRSAGPHLVLDLGIRIAALHHRLDALERQIRERFGSKASAGDTITHLLRCSTDRRVRVQPVLRERRNRQRRLSAHDEAKETEIASLT